MIRSQPSIASDSNIFDSLKVQIRVINALIMREIITRFGRHNIGFMWMFVEPMLFTLGVTTIWIVAGLHKVSNIEIASFALTGYSSVLLWRNCANRCAKAVEPNLSLLYHRQVKVLDLFISRVFLEILGATTSFAILTIAFSYANLITLPANLSLLLLGWLMLTWFSFALGLIVGCISEVSELFDRFWHVLTYLIFPFSGSAFMADWFSPTTREFLLYLPMVQGTELIRHGYYGDLVKTHEDIFYFLKVNLVMTYVGLLFVKYIAKRVKPV